MEKVNKGDLLCTIIVPIIVLASAISIPKGADSILWDKGERAEAIRYNNHVSEYRIWDDEVIIRKETDNTWHLVPKLPFYGGIANALKYDLDYQIILCVIALSLAYIVLVSCLFRITSLWIWIICGGYGIFQWLSESYAHIGPLDVYSTSAVALILMIAWTAYGFYKQRNKIDYNLIGAWKMMREDDIQSQEWFFQDSCKLFITENGVAKEYSWEKLTGKDTIAISDINGNIWCLDYNDANEYDLISDKTLNIAGNIFIKQPTEIKSASELEQKIEDIKFKQALAKRLHQLHKRRYIIYCIVRFSILLPYVILRSLDIELELPDITGSYRWDDFLYLVVPIAAWSWSWYYFANRLSVDGFAERIEKRRKKKTEKEKRNITSNSEIN